MIICSSCNDLVAPISIRIRHPVRNMICYPKTRRRCFSMNEIKLTDNFPNLYNKNPRLKCVTDQTVGIIFKNEREEMK